MRYGEVCKRTDAARIFHVNPQTEKEGIENEVSE